MTSKELYKRFTILCHKWPKDETKLGRDFGEIFRKKLNEQFEHGELSQVKDPHKVSEILKALERIANNTYFNENVLKRSSASGVESWVCRETISNVGLKQFEGHDEDSIIERLKRTLGLKFSASELSQVDSQASRYRSSNDGNNGKKGDTESKV